MIDIPGYKILKTLGRGGMSTVYLALQESVDREVALKVMASTLKGDPEFDERFLREARIAAKLRHPHVVQIHDVGISGDHAYIAMEYLSGGPVLGREGVPRDPSFALRVTREIATALGYAGMRGVVHRDIKPDNILLREDGAAVLSDFGIARAGDSARMTRTGAIIGTPHYMSPEQARGDKLDQRADLYSLGIVLYELLTGTVPYQSNSSPLAVGIMHLTAPLPKLPEHLAWVQPLLDRMLAKNPDERFQNGMELSGALSMLERSEHRPTSETFVGLRLGGTPQPKFATPGASGTQAEQASSALEGDTREPALGDMDDIGANEPKRGRSRSRTRSSAPNVAKTEPAATDSATPRMPKRELKSKATPKLGSTPSISELDEPSRRIESRASLPSGFWMGAGVAAVLALLIVAGFLFGDRLRGLAAPTRMNSLLEQADAALAAQRLIDGPGNARELYLAALAQDPDSFAARQGLQKVGERLLARARSEVQSNQPEAAKASLRAARELAVPAIDADAVQRELDALETRAIEIESGLARAREALAENRLDEADGAVALFRNVLRADPSNALAAAGLRDALARLLERANASAAADDVDVAATIIEQVEAIDPAHLGLPDARIRLAQARERGRQRQIQELEQLLAQAQAAAKRGKYDGIDGAEAGFRAVLERDPGHAGAMEGLRQIAVARLSQANRLIADFRFDEAQALIDEAVRIDPGVPGIAAARIRLRETERQHGGKDVIAISASSSVDPARIAALLDEAGRAAAANQFLSPPGDSAYDKYRAVLALDPNNAAARAGLSGLPALVKRHFESQLAAGKLQAALGQINALETLSRNDAALTGMRRRLAERYLAYAAERLGAGELKRAGDAIDSAAELDPTNAELPALQARLEQARGK